MNAAQAMIQNCPIPTGATIVGFIDRHPADDGGLGWTVLKYSATGVEVAWDGQRQRSLPGNWRGKVKLTQ
jgi:hypothetical protein